MSYIVASLRRRRCSAGLVRFCRPLRRTSFKAVWPRWILQPRARKAWNHHLDLVTRISISLGLDR